jgi:hypothetical protein
MNLKWTVAGTDTVKVRVQATCLDTTIKYVVVISPNAHTRHFSCISSLSKFECKFYR